jgi:hypothetical protein
MNAMLAVEKIVYRQVSFGAVGLFPMGKAAGFGGNVHVGFAAFGHQDS